MKKRFLLVLIIIGLAAGTVFAGGDQVRNQHCGDNGQGAVERHHIQHRINK